MRPEDARRYVAPAAFLAAVTVAVVLIHSGVEAGSSSPSAVRTPPPATHHHRVVTTTAGTKAKPRSHRRSAPAYYTVQAGDTFGVISSKTGVPVATIEQLNPNVSSSMLTIGQRIRVK